MNTGNNTQRLTRSRPWSALPMLGKPLVSSHLASWAASPPCSFPAVDLYSGVVGSAPYAWGTNESVDTSSCRRGCGRPAGCLCLAWKLSYQNGGKRIHLRQPYLQKWWLSTGFNGDQWRFRLPPVTFAHVITPLRKWTGAVGILIDAVHPILKWFPGDFRNSWDLIWYMVQI